MDEFVIGSEKEVTLTFHSRQFRHDGWLDAYSITAAARDFEAVIHAENPPYGTSPTNFFQELASNWAGWSGKKTWGSMEGEYNLAATTDLTGHITLVAELNPLGIPPCFSALLSLVLEAGQLDQIARRAKLFFSV